MRCLALALAWREQSGTVTFIGRIENAALRNRLHSQGIQFRPLDKVYPDPSDIPDTLETIDDATRGGHSDSLAGLVLDGYNFDENYHAGIRRAGIRLIVIDDMAHLAHYEADIIVNQNIGAHYGAYSCNAGAKLLLGTKYAMVRPEFTRERSREKTIPPVAGKVLVTFGASDPENVTSMMIRCLQMLRIPDLHAKVVIGPAHPHAYVASEVTASSGGTIEILRNVQDMAEVMAWADMAVSAAGSTCWELACVGVPFMVIILAENQAAIARGLAESGNGVNLGWFSEVKAEMAARHIEEFMMDREKRLLLSKNVRTMVDGRGAERVVRAIKALGTSESVITA
jgi:UDP-2,4-diacetamido-2,4,6-trideoxy-beta-L-altropyranose hydrolase